MRTMRGGGMGLSRGAERSPRGGSARARAAELPKRKPDLKKLWPEIKALVAPRKGLLIAGMALMAVNRVAGLVLALYVEDLAGQSAVADESSS